MLFWILAICATFFGFLIIQLIASCESADGFCLKALLICGALSLLFVGTMFCMNYGLELYLVLVVSYLLSAIRLVAVEKLRKE